tara:strand:+ start:801 stop:1544 length:744 start_codon:yes stop_codon:yes gene_type:complete
MWKADEMVRILYRASNKRASAAVTDTSDVATRKLMHVEPAMFQNYLKPTEWIEPTDLIKPTDPVGMKRPDLTPPILLPVEIQLTRKNRFVPDVPFGPESEPILLVFEVQSMDISSSEDISSGQIFVSIKMVGSVSESPLNLVNTNLDGNDYIGELKLTPFNVQLFVRHITQRKIGRTHYQVKNHVELLEIVFKQLNSYLAKEHPEIVAISGNSVSASGNSVSASEQEAEQMGQKLGAMRLSPAPPDN